MPVEHCLQNDTWPVKASFMPLISVISVCFEYPSCTLQSFQHVIDFNLRVKIAVRILCTCPVSLRGLLMGKKFTVWPWIFLFIGIRTITVLYWCGPGTGGEVFVRSVLFPLWCPSTAFRILKKIKPLVCHKVHWSDWQATSYAALYKVG